MKGTHSQISFLVLASLLLYFFGQDFNSSTMNNIVVQPNQNFNFKELI